MHATEEMPGAAGARDAALLAIMSGAGLRRSEVVALQLADWTPADRGLLIRHGKGNKDRQVYISAGRGPIVERWIALRGDTPGALLCPVNKSGVVTIRQMTAQAVLVILERLAELAGVADFSPHDLRRTYISIMLDSGADLSSIQKIAGHSRAETTARYDRRGEVAKQRTADMMPELD
jgi:site-specific recombinase XerD